MTSYLLLRCNKESGPYSLEELVSFGIKPYDLVWVNGRSAAWRYPSEIQELQPYAPAVEEQPYDRFYKKQGQTASVVQEADAGQQKADSNQQSGYAPRVLKEEEKTFVPSKSVFVTLPGQIKVVEKKVPVAIKNSEPVVPAISISENPVAARINYSQPLDDIKEMYVKTLQDRKSRIARKSFWMKNLKIAGVILGLVGIGVLAGFIIKPGPLRRNSTAQQPVQAAAILPDTAREPLPAESQAPEMPVTDQVQPEGRPQRQPSQKKSATEEVARESNSSSRLKKESVSIPGEGDTNKEKQFYLGAEKNPISGERIRTVRNNSTAPQETVDKPVTTAKNPLYDQVVVTSNDYKKVAFGGIRNLQLTVTNNSGASLDNVIVELQYLKPSEEPLKTENILFRSIAVNESSTIRVPDTNRGIKVLYRVVSVGR